MKYSVLISLVAAVGSVTAVTSATAVSSGTITNACLKASIFQSCVSTEVDALSVQCVTANLLPASEALPLIASCNCKGLDINYSCAKTYCANDTILQSQYENAYSTCTSVASFSLANPTTTGAAQTSTAAQPSSTAEAAASASSTSSSAGVPTAAANLMVASNAGFGGLVALVAGMAVVM